jgi:hypothetical protein
LDAVNEKDILEEIAAAGLPAGMRAEVVPDPSEAPTPRPVPVAAAPAVRPVDRPYTPRSTPQCGVHYVDRNGREFPDYCSLPPGHQPKSPNANHYTGTIGWWP